MNDTTPADRITAFLNQCAAEGATGDDTPVLDAVGYDLTLGDLRELLAIHDKQAQLLDVAGRELQKSALDTTGPMREIAALRAELDEIAADRARLRRQLDATEAAPCQHDGTAFDALERLHARIHRDFNFDAGECAPPTEDEPALRMMDDLVTYADDLYLPLADATRSAGTAPVDPVPACGHTCGITIGGRCAECTSLPSDLAAAATQEGARTDV